MLSVKSFQCLKAGEIGEGFSKLLVASITGLTREKSGKKTQNPHLCNTPLHSIDSKLCFKNGVEELSWKLSVGVLLHWPQQHICLSALTVEQAGMHEWCSGMALVYVTLPKTWSRTCHPWNTQFLILSSSVPPWVICQVIVSSLTWKCLGTTSEINGNTDILAFSSLHTHLSSAAGFPTSHTALSHQHPHHMVIQP